MSREQDVRDAVDRFLARVRHDTDARLEALASELLQVVRGDMRTTRIDVERAAVEVARAVAKGGPQVRQDLAARIVIAVRRIDEATSIRGTLDALLDAIAPEVTRAAVLVVAGDVVQAYRHHGFPPGAAPVDVPAAAAPAIASAIQLRQITTVAPAGHRPAPDLPAFMRVGAGHAGVLMPVIVGQDVAALMYAEAPDAAGRGTGLASRAAHGAHGWTDHLEILVRHAAARLDTVTSRRTVEVLAGSN